MKKSLLLVFILSLLFALPIKLAKAEVAFNSTTFPDPAFMAELNNMYIDANGDGILSNEEIRNVTSL